MLRHRLGTVLDRRPGEVRLGSRNRKTGGREPVAEPGPLYRVPRDPGTHGYLVVQDGEGRGHVTMLFGAARYFAETRNFGGLVVLIFQPAEEGLRGTFRDLDVADGEMIESRLRRICEGVALANELRIEVDVRKISDVLENDLKRASDPIRAAADVVENLVETKAELSMGSERIADLLRVVPGAFFTLGHGGDVPLLNPGFVFDDTILTVGANTLARIVETRDG